MKGTNKSQWGAACLLIVCLVQVVRAQQVSQSSNLLVDPGFEARGRIGGPDSPTQPGVWGGDLSESVATKLGIVPADGTRMLQFLYGGHDTSDVSASGDVLQIVDLTQHVSVKAIDADCLRAHVEVLVNRIAGNVNVDKEMGVWIAAYDHLPVDWDDIETNSLISDGKAIETDDDPSTWEKVSKNIHIPSGARFLVVWTWVVNNPKGTDPSFLGNFADSIKLSISGGEFIRGDSNRDGNVDISDAQYTLAWLFLGGPEPSCMVAADANDDDNVDLSDAQYTLNYLFLGGPAFPAPYPSWGQDPTPGTLSCDLCQ